ncbi:FYVE, RhoGEF and PH domain-containing protein 6-like [Electrophorus electricus]|uniref:FYVE, RhoGEF and PH domain-containing protein 6-like n=1 Tax=Electrophorus electricus TaxID=8005 RepID=UPI0015CF8E0C|nr:FYVE, RhoGEF and PH domain-containing protein 6-like [Electrophorus electricus]
MERTGHGRGVQKPPVAPKPKVVPPPRHMQHPVAVKPAFKQEVSQLQKHAARPFYAPKPCLYAVPLESKPLTSRGMHQIHFKSWQVDLLDNTNGHLPEYKNPEQDYDIPISVCAEGKCHDCSPKDNSKRLTQHEICTKRYVNSKAENSRNPAVRKRNNQHTTLGIKGQSHKHPVQNSTSALPARAIVIHDKVPAAGTSYENVPIANGSVIAIQSVLQSSANGTHVVSMKESVPVLSHKKEGTTVAPIKLPASENTSPSGVAEIQCDDMRLPISYPDWKSVLSEQRQTQHVHLAGLSQITGKKECMSVQDVYKNEHSVDEEPNMKIYKCQCPTAMNLPKQPKPNSFAAKQVHYQNKGNVSTASKLVVKPYQDIVSNITKWESNNSTTKNPTGKKPRTKMQAKAKSFSPADINHPNVQKKTSSQKIMALDLSMKTLPMFDEQTVDEDWHWHASRNQNGTCTQVSLYRSHEVKVQGKDLLYKQAFSVPSHAIEQSVDEETNLVGVGNALEEYHIYEDIPDYVNVPSLSSEYIQMQQPTTIQQGHLSNTEEDVYEKFDVPGEFINTTVDQNYTERNVYEDVESSDDTDSEGETANSSEEDNNSSDYGNGEYQNDVKRTKLFHIAKEIMTSEKVFVDVLKLLNISFRDAVLKASFQLGKPVIEERVLNQILSSLPQLYELNCDLLRELDDRMAHWNENSGVADIFLKKGPYLKMYTSYICEFDKNVALLEEQCKKNPAFAKVVREFESSPCCANLALKHYMLKPIQRLPQYQLLLSDYLKNLNENSPDYKNTKAALSIVKGVTNHANESMKQGDNFQKLMQVQCRLTGQHEIVQPGRVLLKEGTLMKLSRKVMQPIMLFLFNDTLLYTTSVQSGQYKLKSMLSLAGMKVSKPSQEGYQNELNIESVERSFILSASSPASRDEWLEAISAAIDDYAKKKISFNSSKSHEEGDRDGPDSTLQLGSKAPIWIPDLRTSMCMICTCVFTLTWRRHHCRACGKVVCQACSSNKHPLEYLKNQPARVCDQCLEILQQNSSGNQTPGSFLSPNAKPSSTFPFRRQKKIPAALKEVSANTNKPSMSGYMERMKANKKPWKRLWFVIKNKVLYTYAASEDVAALESLPLLGFSLREKESESFQQFWLYHKDVLFYTFKTDDSIIYHRWVEAFREAMVL